MAEVVAERDRFGQLFVEPEDFRDAPRDLRHLERVREARTVVIAFRREEDLSLVLEPAERLAVNHAVAVPLKRRTDVIFPLRVETPTCAITFRRLRGQDLVFTLFELFANSHL